MNNLQKKILIFLIVLACISPAGILLPKYFSSGGAWGEWSADKVQKDIGYTPGKIKEHSNDRKAPLADYTLNSKDESSFHQSIYYILSGIAGTGLSFLITYFISKKIVK